MFSQGPQVDVSYRRALSLFMHLAQYREILGEEDPSSGSHGGRTPGPSGTPNIMVELTHLFVMNILMKKSSGIGSKGLRTNQCSPAPLGCWNSTSYFTIAQKQQQLSPSNLALLSSSILHVLTKGILRGSDRSACNDFRSYSVSFGQKWGLRKSSSDWFSPKKCRFRGLSQSLSQMYHLTVLPGHRTCMEKLSGILSDGGTIVKHPCASRNLEALCFQIVPFAQVVHDIVTIFHFCWWYLYKYFLCLFAFYVRNEELM